MERKGPARVERRLAAILAADVAGYSRLIEADEERTLGRLKALSAEVIDPRISAHREPHRQDRLSRPRRDRALFQPRNLAGRSQRATERRLHKPLPSGWLTRASTDYS